MGERRLSILDTSFLQLESASTPMHVGGLMMFELPEDKDRLFVGELVSRFRGGRVFNNPWNYRLQRPSRFQFRPVLKETFDVDMEYHIRHHALPYPGGERELGQLISRVHSQRLDFRKPLWEVHVIEGLEPRRFAVYVKIHHALADGISATKLLMAGLSVDPSDDMQLPFWAAGSINRSGKPRQVKAVPKLPGVRGSMRFAREVTRSWLGRGDAVSMRSAPMTILNDRIDGQRRFATHSESMERLKRIASAANCSLNDLVLAMCGTVLREYLLDHDALPEKSLTVNIPVSLHKPGAKAIKNDIALILATLGTNIADDRIRLEKISESTSMAKEQLRNLPEGSQGLFGNLVLAPQALSVLSVLAGRVKPAFNVIVSNVPGPKETQYLYGARLVNLYPVSIPLHGSAINFTCFSYDGYLNFGLTACRDSLPHMQQMAVALGSAVDRYQSIYLGAASSAESATALDHRV